MRITGIILIVTAVLALAITTVFAAGKGKGVGNGSCQGQCPAGGQSACQSAATGTETTLTGAVEALVQPDAGTRGGPVRFTLAIDGATTLVLLGPPPALKALGLSLANGTAVSVSGWPVTRDNQQMLITRTITVGEKTYTLRNADGTPVWQGQCAKQQGQSGQCQRGQGGCRGGGCRN